MSVPSDHDPAGDASAPPGAGVPRPGRRPATRTRAVIHVACGMVLGPLALVAMLALLFIGTLGGAVPILIAVPLAPMVLFWGLDLLWVPGRGSLARGATAGGIVLAGGLLAFAIMRSTSNDELTLMLTGVISGALGVFLTRLDALFPPREDGRARERSR